MAYLMIAQKQYEDPAFASFYNVGPEDQDCVNTGMLATIFCEKWGEGQHWENRFVGGPHEANFLKLDCSKIRSVFGWKPRWHVAESIEKTVEWFKLWNTGNDMTEVMSRQIDENLNDEK